MCWIAVKKEGKDIPYENIKKAQRFNKDGYGVSWYESDHIQTVRTLDFDRFLGILSALKEVPCIIHLRNTTAGKTCMTNTHPFEIPSGVMFHNGTISTLKTLAKKDQSDTSYLADLLWEAEYKKVEDVAPLLQPIIGKHLNRLVFLENDGRITIMNSELGMVEDDIWYSNDYHKKPDTYSRTTTTGVPTQTPSTDTKKYGKKGDGTWGWLYDLEDEDDEWDTDYTSKYKVFVYGTLKEGYSNHTLLKGSKFIGKATTKERFIMIGKDMSFPYILEQSSKGKIITGEVYEVDYSTLLNLDRLEGNPYHYYKEKIDTYVDGILIPNVNVYIKTNVKQTDLDKEYISEFIKGE